MGHYQKLDRFPLGAIHAEGFLKEQMLRGKDGMTGHLYELEPEMIYYPYIEKKHVKAWSEENQDGWGAEISGNYWNGYIQSAFTLNDPEMIQVATNWVNAMMKNQREDGYLGTYLAEDALRFEDYNAWGTACGMRGLIAFYEATGRKDVLEAVHKCLLWFCENWSGDRKTSYAGAFIIDPMIFTYYHTGDQRLVDFAREYLEFLDTHDIFRNSCRSMLEDDYYYNADHTAGLGNTLRLPALVYSATGNEKYLKGSLRKLGQVLEKSVHITGSPVSVTEYLGPVGSTTETEYCSYAFYNATYSALSFITGDPRYGDLMEQMFYNGAQGARKKDEKAIAYLNSPNQIYATTISSAACEEDQVYAPCVIVSCCPVNAVTVVPEFIRGMMLRDEKENVYVMAYGPCSLNYHGIRITEKTHYPFRNHVSFELDCEKEFDLNLKIPGWSKGFTVQINGEIQEEQAECGFVKLHRAWKPGDTVHIEFRAEIEVIRVDDSDFAGKYPIAVKYGPLVYAYHIPEEWRAFPGHPMTPLPPDWHWYNVWPVYQEADAEDLHERIGLKRNQISWNIAMDENLKPEDIEIEELPEEGYVWEKPMIRLKTHCYKAPYLCANYPRRTFEAFGDRQFVTEKLPLVLEPYGCTNLRITYFPRAKL